MIACTDAHGAIEAVHYRIDAIYRVANVPLRPRLDDHFGVVIVVHHGDGVHGGQAFEGRVALIGSQRRCIHHIGSSARVGDSDV